MPVTDRRWEVSAPQSESEYAMGSRGCASLVVGGCRVGWIGGEGGVYPVDPCRVPSARKSGPQFRVVQVGVDRFYCLIMEQSGVGAAVLRELGCGKGDIRSRRYQGIN